jgi:hypothetical protein
MGLFPAVPEPQVADAAHYLIELIEVHGPEALRLAPTRGPEPLMRLREEIMLRRDHLLDLAGRAEPGPLADAAIAFVRTQEAWESLVLAGASGRDADRQVAFSQATRTLKRALGGRG